MIHVRGDVPALGEDPGRGEEPVRGDGETGRGELTGLGERVMATGELIASFVLWVTFCCVSLCWRLTKSLVRLFACLLCGPRGVCRPLGFCVVFPASGSVLCFRSFCFFVVAVSWTQRTAAGNVRKTKTAFGFGFNSWPGSLSTKDCSQIGQRERHGRRERAQQKTRDKKQEARSTIEQREGRKGPRRKREER